MDHRKDLNRLGSPVPGVRETDRPLADSDSPAIVALGLHALAAEYRARSKIIPAAPKRHIVPRTQRSEGSA